MSAEIQHEDRRFGRTGPSHLTALRSEFWQDGTAYALDAPAYIARGSLQSHFHRQRLLGDYHYITATEARP